MRTGQLLVIAALTLPAALISPTQALRASHDFSRSWGGEKSAGPGAEQACVTYDTRRGTRCNDPDSLEYTITNECASGASVTVWHKRSADDVWREGASYYLYPNRSVSGWWCNGPIPYDMQVRYRLR